ncbi:hypothetical protein RQP46_006616 [Phenoliferia psychrophenolica]
MVSPEAGIAGAAADDSELRREALSDSVPHAPPSPPTQAHPNSQAHGLPQPGERDLSKGDEVGLLRHQLRLSRAEVLSLQKKLGMNPAPFGTTLRRQSSNGGTLSPPARPYGRASTPDPTDSRATSPILGAGPFPGAVSLTKALLSEDGLPLPDSTDDIPGAANGDDSHLLHHQHHHHASTGSSRASAAASNPFFGSAGSSRERISKSAASASSGSGKVISGLQSELLARSSALDTARQQLRVSQRAVEFLTRQNEDLKESKERLSSENEGLSKTISRKERLQEEAVGRASVAETSLSALQTTHSAAVSSHRTRLKEVEDASATAEEARQKAESEYQALRLGMKSMAEGWKADLDWLRADLVKLEAKHQRDLDEAKLKHQELTKLFEGKEAENLDIKTNVAKIQVALKSTERTIAELMERFEEGVGAPRSQDDDTLKRCQDLEAEFRRMRRLMREHT